eukprot:4017366-Pyramimonas_sp.AAC.1
MAPPCYLPGTRQAVCVRCRACMDYPGFTVSDAGQAYEALESKSMRVAVDSLFQRAEAQRRTRTLS